MRWRKYEVDEIKEACEHARERADRERTCTIVWRDRNGAGREVLFVRAAKDGAPTLRSVDVAMFMPAPRKVATLARVEACDGMQGVTL